MKILLFIPYPPEDAPSQRFRFEQYLHSFKRIGYHFNVQAFFPAKNWRVFYTKGVFFRKVSLLLSGFAKRMIALLIIQKYDYVFIHREIAPIGPPVFEWVLAKVFRKKIIYDFDDAIWLTDKVEEHGLEKLLRWRNKVGLISKWSYKVSCGNEYLCAYARQFNKHVVLNPTTIDTERVHNRALYRKVPPPANPELDDSVIIGWTGSHSTLKYLSFIESVLQKLQKNSPQVRFLVIADREPDLLLQRMDFLIWNKETEVTDLMQIDIGIMPLPDDEWTKGKCGFKALQYMAMEIPCVVSPVGVNKQIIEHGVGGFLAESENDWINYLTQLVNNAELRKQMGKRGREKVIKHYSVVSNTSNFLSLFE